MAGQRTSFGKLQRDRAKKAKADAKRARRQDKDLRDPMAPDDQQASDVVLAEWDTENPLSPAELLAPRVEAIHRQLEAGTISFEDFEEEKAALLAQLTID